MPGKKLLVADDSLTIQKVIRLALSNEGYEIQTASDGNDATQQVSLFRPDIVLIDVSLPGKSAFEVKREINTHDDLQEVRFVLMSSAFEKVDEVQAQEVTFHGRLTKPFDPAHLRQVLSDVLHQVTEKRMEKTTIIHTPSDSHSSPPPFPKFVESRQISTPPAPPPPVELPSISFEIPIPESNNSPVDSLWDPNEDFSKSSISIPVPPPPPSLSSPTKSSTLPPTPPDFSTPPDFGTSPDFVPPPPPSFPSSSDLPGSDLANFNSFESDIKQLTESTLRGAGANLPPPMPPAAPSVSGISDSPIAGAEDFQWSVNEPTMKPLPGMLEDETTSSFRFDEPMPPSAPPSAPPAMPSSMPTIDPPQYQEDSFASNSSSYDYSAPLTANLEAQIEKLVQSQVQATLEKLAQKILPEVAERIIKQEIHRLLSDQS